MQNKLTPAEIAHIHMRYPNADTINIKKPQTIHAKSSLLKSHFGCSNYKRDNFKWDKYRLLLIPYKKVNETNLYITSEQFEILTDWEKRDFLFLKNVNVPLFFGINHWANGKTAIELNIAIDLCEYQQNFPAIQR